MNAEAPLETRIVRSFDRYDHPPAAGLLTIFRRRLIGELFGDPDAILATLDTAFKIVIHVGDASVTLPGTAYADGVGVQATSGMLMWTEFDDLLVDSAAIAAGGALLNLHLEERTLRSSPIGLFLRFSGDRMASQVVFMGAADVTDVSAYAMPSVESLRAQLSA